MRYTKRNTPIPPRRHSGRSRVQSWEIDESVLVGIEKRDWIPYSNLHGVCMALMRAHARGVPSISATIAFESPPSPAAQLERRGVENRSGTFSHMAFYTLSLRGECHRFFQNRRPAHRAHSQVWYVTGYHRTLRSYLETRENTFDSISTFDLLSIRSHSASK